MLLLSGGIAAQSGAGKQSSVIAGVPVGVITYSYRSMPAQDLPAILEYVQRSGISEIELMGDAVEAYLGCPKEKSQVAAWRAGLSMKAYKKVRKMFDQAGIHIYAFKPNALGERNSDAEIAYALKAGKILGARAVTVELPKDPEQTARLGRLAAQYKMAIGYHNHLQGNDQAWTTALSQSSYNTINLDCGHYIAAGGNNTRESLLAFIEAHHDRITSMHLKDRKNKENGQANLPWGQGDTPIGDILRLIRDRHYAIPVSIELEYPVPEGSDAVQEVRKSLDYARRELEK
ncbi:hypothetical protein GCM10027051_36380 [Niabella terrae]